MTQNQNMNEEIVRYVKSDIMDLLKHNDIGAGPLFTVTLNGIDIFGGFLYGFDKGSKMRSVDFMQKEMGFKKELANFLYIYARCGMVHEGSTKVGLKFGSRQTDKSNSGIFFKGTNDIAIEVKALAEKFLSVINNFPASALSNFKSPESPDATVFKEAFNVLNKEDIKEFEDSVKPSDGTNNLLTGYSGVPSTDINTDSNKGCSGVSGFGGSPTSK